MVMENRLGCLLVLPCPTVHLNKTEAYFYRFIDTGLVDFTISQTYHYSFAYFLIVMSFSMLRLFSF